MSLYRRLQTASSLVGSDLYRYCGRTGFRAFIKTYYFTPGFNYCVWLRFGNVLRMKIFILILHRKKVRFGIDIPYLKMGKGMYIGHFGGIVINDRAVIGDNCNISQGVTIGVANSGPKRGVPTIGDCVYIGPGAKIFGDIHIGNNVAIGANSVITSDIPDNAVVVGVPARVVSYDGSAGYINNKA